MIEFITQHWQFFVAGLILLALIVYWVVDSIRNKKAKERQLNQMEAMLQETEDNETDQPKEESLEESKETQTEEVEEVEEEKAEEETTDKKKPSTGLYMISYDKEKKDWVIKKRGNQRATKRTKTKKEALEAVKTLTENQNTNFVVKKKDGKFQKK